MVSAVFTFIAACLLLAFVVIAGKVARSAGRLEKPDPFRWILFIAVPLWVVRAFVEFVLTALGTANVRVNTLINPLTLLLGIASLATIAALPSAVITTKTNKEVEA
ncbi:hypothetical protein DL96DRAFT_1614672 [Flagelloscypha sp. PMI_526]|nr:hypothetical protein DL96DRAFT_1614672 [Flagelloscypha sp. PMI_526]